jgi:hypothetical protein
MKNGLPKFKAQGSTEYLVLLAVVLIIALVSLALLSFFPGTSLDAKLTQNKMYWSSASPIAIVNLVAKNHPNYGGGENNTVVYMRLRNNGAYPIRITKMISKYSNDSLDLLFGNSNLDTYLYPGEEKEFCSYGFEPKPPKCISGIPPLWFDLTDYVNWQSLKSYEVCHPRIKRKFFVKDLVFEYIEYVEGKQITKTTNPYDLYVECT